VAAQANVLTKWPCVWLAWCLVVGAVLALRLGCPSVQTPYRERSGKVDYPGTWPSKPGLDWAWRKGVLRHNLVDLERHRPIELAARSGSCDVNQLSAHPGVELPREIVQNGRWWPRQGTDSYQVADRFHLLQNLAETLAQAFGAHSQTLKTIASTHKVISHCSRWDCSRAAVLPPQQCPRSNVLPNSVGRGEKLTKKAGNYIAKVGCSNCSSGGDWSHDSISLPTYFHLPERKDAVTVVGAAHSDPYKDYVLERWNDGCHDALRLFGEIQQRGYSGSYDHSRSLYPSLSSAQGTQQKTTASNRNYQRWVSLRNCLLHRVVLHIWYYDDRKNGNQTMNNCTSHGKASWPHRSDWTCPSVCPVCSPGQPGAI